MPDSPACSIGSNKDTVNAFACNPLSTRGALALVSTVLAVLAGCASQVPKAGSATPAPATGTAPSQPSTPPRPAPPPAVVSPLMSEQRWLEEWFRGTPVVIALADSSTLAVDVPLVNSFDAGSSSIKPALAAVLDRVATSLRRQPAMRVSIAAPADANGGAALTASRTQQVREHLVSRGVSATRMAAAGAVRAGTAVQLRIVVTPQAIGHLDDATLPVPASGVKPTAAAAPGVKR